MKTLFAPVVALALALVLALPAAAQDTRIPLPALSAYLNALRQASGEFTQINADGTLSTGRIYIRRPGRIRFEYDPPAEALVIAARGEVVIWDPKSNQGPESYPLSRTPLSIILADNVDLTRARMVTGHESEGPTTLITAQDPENPDYGYIQLVFTDNPVELRQWIITDNAGQQTTVVLGDLDTATALENRLFSIDRALPRRQGR